MQPSTLQSLLVWGRKELEREGIDSATLDSRVLLLDAAALRHEMLLADPHRLVPNETARIFRAHIERRKRREPVSRILGEREFYGRPFKVTPATLDPRADTETLVEAALRLSWSRLLDLGTGTGAVALTLLCERPYTSGVAADISSAALEVAHENAGRLGVASRVHFVVSDWYDAVEGRFDLIVSNPPYIASPAIAGLSEDVKGYDPKLSLDGGLDGLHAYRHIARGARDKLCKNGHILVEIGEGQKSDVLKIFEEFGFELDFEGRDLAGRIRCLTLSTN